MGQVEWRNEPRWSDQAPPAERMLYEHVAAAVGDRAIILNEVMLSVPDRGRLDEAEADLVLVDPEHGVLVVEVKGGTVAYDANRRAWRRQEAAMAEIRDPVAQVKRVRSFLRRALADAQLPVETIPIRWAVATPECTMEAPGDPVLGADRLWDARALADVAAAIRRAQGRLVDGEVAIGDQRADRIARVLRGRAVEGAPSTALLVGDHDRRVRALTESHRNVMHRFTRDKRVLVRGAAGTGKTVLALEVAAKFAAQGDRVLLTCWHKLLGTHLRRRLEERLRAIESPAADDVTGDVGGHVVVNDLVSLVSDPGERPEPSQLSDWYYHVLPDRLDQAGVGEFDVIVLDEAQDPNELWLVALSGVLRDGGRWYAFADRQQDLFGTAPTLRDFVDVEHELRENFRNSIQIADFAALFGQVETDCLTGSGPPIRYERVPADRVVGRVPEFARKLVRDEGFAPGDVACLWLYHNPFRGDPAALIAQDEAGETVTTNAAAFKGMERPAVVLGLDVRSDKTPEEQTRNIYAAATRARSLLVLVGDPDELRRTGIYKLAAMFNPPAQ